MKRSPSTPFKPDSDLEGVSANDVRPNSIESAHFAPSEVEETIEFEITSDATGAGIDILGGAAAVEIPQKYRVKDVTVECRAANASGTVTVRKATTAISDAIVCAVDKVLGRAGTIDNDESTIDNGDVLNVVTNGAADRGFVTITVVKQA